MKKLVTLLVALVSSAAFAQLSQYQHLPNQADGGPPLGTPTHPYMDAYVNNLHLSGASGVPLATANLATPAPNTSVAYYVDPDAGVDTNFPCTTIGAPCQHAQFVTDQIPLIPRAAYTINMRAGTYAETIYDNHICPTGGLFTWGITYFGYDLSTPVITGSTTGTLGSPPSSGATWTATIGVNWVAHALKGMFIQVTSGSDINKLYPIADNATSSLDLPTYRSALNGATFAIVQQAAQVTRAASQNMSFLVAGVGDNSCITIQRLNITSGSFYGIYFTSGSVTVSESYLDSGSFTAINTYGTKSQLSMNRSFVNNHGTNTGLNFNQAEGFAPGAVVIDGGKYGMLAEFLQFLGNGSSGHLLIQNATTAGAAFLGGLPYQATFASQKFIFRTNAVGLQVQSGFNGLIQNMELTANTSHGMQFLSNDHGIGHNSLNCVSCTITGNGGDGVRVETSHNALQFTGTTTISSNTGVGVNFITVTGQIPSSHNAAFVGTGITMATNGHDFSVDGTNFSTLANLQAQVGKFLIDTGGPGGSSALFNRITSQ